jgi:hypothetical protein
VQRTVELLDPQEVWVQELLTARPELTFADVVRWAVGEAMRRGTDGAAASIPHLTWKPGPSARPDGEGRTSKWPRRKTCVGCGKRTVNVRPCCDHEDAKPVCDGCYANSKGNHAEHGSYRREG